MSERRTPPNRVLVLFAHPALEKSRVNRVLIDGLEAMEGVTFHDLYEAYPDLDIDVQREQALLTDHDVIVMHHPFFWYSTPALIKEWEDIVLEHGFAYGAGGDKLDGKRMLLAITAAGSEDAYTVDGYQHFPIRTFLTPLEQTARLCNMSFAPPYVLYGSLRAPDAGVVEPHVDGYIRLIEAVRDDRYDFESAGDDGTVNYESLPVRGEP